VHTAEEAAIHWQTIDGSAVKNLFLRNKKGDRHYLVILGIEKQADLRSLVKVIGDDRLSFGSPERLMKYLGVTPGSVSPLGLIHDTAKVVRVIVDSDLRSAERLIFHPNDNTASLTISGADFARFLEHQGNSVRWTKT
jgi:Ala-tRNA(Pro) deacylase